MRQRGQDPSPITGIGFGSNSTSMIHALQYFIGILQDLVASLPPNMGNKTDPAAVVLKCRVIKAPLTRSFKYHRVAIGIGYLIHEHIVQRRHASADHREHRLVLETRSYGELTGQKRAVMRRSSCKHNEFQPIEYSDKPRMGSTEQIFAKFDEAFQ